ncbi:MAG: phospholipase [Alphaproteobacteria bacterium]|nr:phospholipase [Alphaproteobacteria bacterium]
MTDADEKLNQALAAALPPLLTALDVLAYVARHLHPPYLAEVVAQMGRGDEAVRPGIAALQLADWPDSMTEVKARMESAAELVCTAFESLRTAARSANGLMEAYVALRSVPRAQEALYPLTVLMPLMSRFFLNTGARMDTGLLERLEQGSGDANTGVMHSKSASGDPRGGFSLYVPESYDPAVSSPVIFALHGGSGNGRDFLWRWLCTARSNGAILVSPSSRGKTWALQGPDIDTANLISMLNYVRERWNVDEKHILMTGMSDGGTFTYISGMQEESPFTHLAPVAASFHPMLLEFFPAGRIRSLPVHIMHGALDWMFPSSNAEETAEALDQMGAKVTYREMPDLSHTYPSDEEHGEIYDWFIGRR